MSNTSDSNTSNEEKSITMDGIVVKALPALEYQVQVDYKGIKHTLTCHVSGKMKKNFIEIKKGDEVTIKISLYDIDRGIIVRRLTSRGAPRTDVVQNTP